MSRDADPLLPWRIQSEGLAAREQERDSDPEMEKVMGFEILGILEYSLL